MDCSHKKNSLQRFVFDSGSWLHCFIIYSISLYLELLISCLQMCPDIHHIFPIPAHNWAIQNASHTMIPTFDPFYIRQETWENCMHTCHVLFLFTIHIKGVSSKNTLRTLIFHYLTTPFWPLVWGGTKERRPWDGYIFRAEPHSNPHTLQLCPPCVPCP